MFPPLKNIVQLWALAHVWLVDKSYEDEDTLREQNLPLKCCQPFEELIHFEEGFRSFHLKDQSI